MRKETFDFLYALYVIFSVLTGTCFILNGDLKYNFLGFIAISAIKNTRRTTGEMKEWPIWNSEHKTYSASAKVFLFYLFILTLYTLIFIR